MLLRLGRRLCGVPATEPVLAPDADSGDSMPLPSSAGSISSNVADAHITELIAVETERPRKRMHGLLQETVLLYS